MYLLYEFPGSGNCYKISLLLTQLGLDFEAVKVDILKGESRTPAFLAINPNGRVPVLQVDDRYLPESNAAMWYLAEGTPLLPADRFERAQALQWMFFEQYSHEPYIATVRYWVSILGEAEGHRREIDERMPRGYAALDVMERHLETREYFVGGGYSIADIALYAYTHVAHEGGFDLAPYGAINAWLERVEAQPGFVAMAAQ